MAIIKWRRLKDICEETTGYSIDIILTTAPGVAEYNGVVKFNPVEKTGTIVLNASSCKSIHSIQMVLSHELAHIKQGNNEHDHEHAEQSESILQNIVTLYGARNHGGNQ